MATLMERAFELAKSGSATSLPDIARKLGDEGFTNIDGHLSGPSLRKQLKALIDESFAGRIALLPPGPEVPPPTALRAV